MPKITLRLKTQQGKKIVTKVKGLEVFGVSLAAFVEALKGLVVSSIMIQAVVRSKLSEGLVEVLVQGNQEEVVEKLLMKQEIAKKFLVVNNKLKKK